MVATKSTKQSKKKSSSKDRPEPAKKAKTKSGAAVSASTATKPAKKGAAEKTGTPRAPSADEPATRVGRRAPSFKLRDQNDRLVTSASLAKKPYVLYFYPKDNTPGCTTESCDFRDESANFSALGVTVIGVSPDSTKSHAGFASKYELPHTLLSDPEKELAQAYGVWALKKNYGKEYWGIVRSTFLVGADGKVKKEWRGVRVKGHIAAVLEAAQA